MIDISGNGAALAPAKPREKPFAKGNPGRRPGTRCKATMLAEKLLSKDIKDVSNVVVEMAKGGDLDACKIILDRIFPVPKSRRITFPMREIHSVACYAAAKSGKACLVVRFGPHPAPTPAELAVMRELDRVGARLAVERAG